MAQSTAEAEERKLKLAAEAEERKLVAEAEERKLKLAAEAEERNLLQKQRNVKRRENTRWRWESCSLKGRG